MEERALSSSAEHAVIEAASWLKLGIEAISVTIVLAAIVFAVFKLLGSGTTAARIGLARGLSLALEFQLAADIVGTAISPNWEQIGKLAAVAAIRTFLNYFLQHELAAEVEVTKKETG